MLAVIMIYRVLTLGNQRVIKPSDLSPDCYLGPLGVEKVGPVLPAGLCNDNDVFVGLVLTLAGSLLGIK